MTDPITTVKTAATAAALAKLLDSEVIKNLLLPVTQQIGLAAGDVGGIVRKFTTLNLLQVLTRWAEQRNNRPLDPAEFAKAIPLLHAASLVSDEDLQKRWAALLESSVSEPKGVLPSFGQTLSQLTPDEARYLELIYLVAATKDMKGDGSVVVGSMDNMLEVYDPEFRLSYGESSDEMASQLESRTNHLRLLLADLERLGLLICERMTEQKEHFILIKDVELQPSYAVSAYGVSFVKAVTPKH
jgi:hypothetical protein